MREILFRGKRSDTGEWVEGYYEAGYTYENNIPFYRIIVFDNATRTSELVFVCPETVGQYTGLTDRNGKKIFEGDIIKMHNFKYEVAFNYGAFGTVYKMLNGVKSVCAFNDSEYYEDATKYEVIGNIHDNPELLEGKE